MTYDENEIRANREYFAEKLRSTKQRYDVLLAVEAKDLPFILLDTRRREAYVEGHIPGAWCAPLAELDQVIPQLPRDREIIAYCSGHD